MENLPKKILIVGGGTAGWLVANELDYAWGDQGVEITLIESASIGTVGVGEGTTPSIRSWFAKLGVPENEWMPRCNATYKCGISFPDWSKIPGFETYFHPFYSNLDTDLALKFFDNCHYRRMGHDVPAHPDHYFVTTELARQCRAPVPKEPLPYEHDYGYHFDATLLGEYLRDRATAHEVSHVSDTISRVELDQQGNIACVHTAEHGPIDANFYIDCSGLSGLLMQTALDEPLICYRKYLRNDRAVAIPTPLSDKTNIPSETVSKALKFGWVWHIPLMNRMGNGYVYCSDYVTEEEAETELRTYLGVESDHARGLHLRWNPGRIENHWKRNCLAIGLAQGFLEPLEAAMLNVIQFSVESFVESVNRGNFTNRYQQEFNVKVNSLIDDIRDYLQLHYKLNTRDDTEYWRDLRNNNQLSEYLTEIIQTWDSTAHFDTVMQKHRDTQAYKRTSWYCMLSGMGRYGAPKQQPKGSSDKYIGWLQSQCAARAEQFHPHSDYLGQIYKEH